MKTSIAELRTMSTEDAEIRIRERIVEAMVLTNKPELAIAVLWQDVNAYLGVEVRHLELSKTEVH